MYKHCKKSDYTKSPDLSSKSHLHCIFQNTKCRVIIACITADRCHLLQPSNESYKQEQLVYIRGSTQHGTKTLCTFSLFCNSSDVLIIKVCGDSAAHCLQFMIMCRNSFCVTFTFVYTTFAENKVG